jgi:hypothetical protein
MMIEVYSKGKEAATNLVVEQVQVGRKECRYIL